LRQFAAVVQAYGEEKIELTSPESKANKTEIRYAPSFQKNVCTTEYTHGCSVQTIGKFLGWLFPSGRAYHKIEWILDALELIELKLLREEDIDALAGEFQPGASKRSFINTGF
jgi:hypothetical protein